MAFQVWCEIVCSHCKATTAGRFFSGRVLRSEMFVEAVANGFRRVTNSNEWHCRQCAQKAGDHDA